MTIEDELETAAEELERAVDALRRSREAHRRIEAVLLGVLEHVPVPVVLLDAHGRVHAAGAAATAQWGAELGRLLAPGRIQGDAHTEELEDAETGERLILVVGASRPA